MLYICATGHGAVQVVQPLSEHAAAAAQRASAFGIWAQLPFFFQVMFKSVWNCIYYIAPV